jgi:hypothetical protein
MNYADANYGCNLSEALCNMHLEESIKEALELRLKGVKVNNGDVNMLLRCHCKYSRKF